MTTILFPKTLEGLWRLKHISLDDTCPLQAWAEENIRAVKIYTDRNRVVCYFMDSDGKLLGPFTGQGQEDNFVIQHGTLDEYYDLTGAKASVRREHNTPYLLIEENGEALLELWGI